MDERTFSRCSTILNLQMDLEALLELENFQDN